MEKTFHSNNRQGMKPWKILLFAVLAGIIIFFSGYMALKGEDNYDSQAYGTTTDTSLPLVDGSEIRAEFTISHEGFEGIQIKFKSEIKSFEKERVEFSLRDLTTGEIVAEYDLDMNTAFPLGAVFIPLPYEVSEKTKVQLSMVGKDISSVPSVYISKKQDNKSVLYRENLIVNDYYLAFSAVYHEKTGININYILKGGIYLFLLLLIFLWRWVFTRAERSRELVRPGKERHHIRNFARLRKWIWFVVLTAAYFGLAMFVNRIYIENKTDDKETVQIVSKTKGSGNSNYLSLTAASGDLEQTFQAGRDHLSSIAYDVQVLKDSEGAKLHIMLLDQNENISYLDEEVLLSDLPAERSRWDLLMDKEYPSSTSKTFHIIVEAEDFGDAEVAFYTGKPGRQQDRVTVGGIARDRIPLLYASYANNNYLSELYRIFIVAAYGFLLMCYVLFIVRKSSLQTAFIPVVLYLGTLYLLTIPVYSVPDEYTHIDCAYRVSNALIGIPVPENMPGYDYKRAMDVETDEYLTYNADAGDYRRLYKSAFSVATDEELVLCTSRYNFSNANVLYYLPSGIGITIARLLHLGTLTMLLLGRFMNLLASTLLIYMCIRKLPVFAELIFVYTTLPIFLQEAASFSYDCMVNAFAMVFLCSCLSLAFNEKPNVLSDGALMLFTMLQLSFVKGGVYLPLCLCVLLVAGQRKWKWRKCLPYVILLLICVGTAFLQGNIVRYINNYFSTSHTRVNPFVGTEMYTFSYLISHPVDTICIFVNTFFTQGSRLLYEIFGGKMGSLVDIQMPWMYEVFFLLVLLWVIRKSPRIKGAGKVNAAFCCYFMPICSALLVGLSMLLADTKMGAGSISGLQGRYFLPVVFLPLAGSLCFLREEEHKGSFDIERMILISVYVVFLFNVIMTVL